MIRGSTALSTLEAAETAAPEPEQVEQHDDQKELSKGVAIGLLGHMSECAMREALLSLLTHPNETLRAQALEEVLAVVNRMEETEDHLAEDKAVEQEDEAEMKAE